MIILGREKFREPRVGCCGMTRHDMIYPIGDFVTEDEFIKDAYNMVKSYGVGTAMRVADTYALEYFSGELGQNLRDDGGESLFLLELMDDGKWHYYKDNKLVFTVDSLKELQDKWEFYLR